MTRRDEAPDDDRALDRAIAAARPAESAALVLARARIAGQLFGDAAVGIGRFRVLERLGGGGMGVVYAAYDPELDRGVALKTVHLPAAGRAPALREAKALARLSHPNVVPVFDVGLADEHVYIVMELVRGETLRAYVAGRSIAEILEVYRQAGQALAAAHAAGLVHRDFKPDNALRGTDGRVRVVDFGLACEEQAAPGGVAGTPRYMAPEQAAGASATPAADQYSFAIALGEALATAATPVPRWLAAIVERARAPAPADRFDSMTELLRALGRDPARLRRRRLAIAGAAGVTIAVGAAAFAIGTRRRAAAATPCAGGEVVLAAAWPADARARELARIAGLSAYGDELATRLERAVADHATRWIAVEREACLAHRAGLLPDPMFDRRARCLARSSASLAALAGVAREAGAPALPEVARAASALGDPGACADPRVLATEVAPPPHAIAGRLAALDRELERARVHAVAGQLDVAATVAARAVAIARGLGYPPALAEALVIEGRARMASDGAAAIARLSEAMQVGLASGELAVAIEAWARRAWLIGTGPRPRDALAGLDVIEPLAARSRFAFPRALLHNNLGSVYLARGDRAAARAAFERALAEAHALAGGEAAELIGTRHNLALVVDDPARRDALLASAEADYTRRLGADHPDTLTSRIIRAELGVTSMPRARATLARACPGLAGYPALAAAAGECFLELADLAIELADPGAARAALDRARGLLGAHGRPEAIVEVAGYAALLGGDAGAAADRFARGIAALPPRADEPWYQALSRARQQLGLARARRAEGRPRDALAALAPAIATLAAVVRDHPAVAYQRRLARAHAERAHALAAIGGDPRADARAALDWLEPAGGAPRERARLASLTAGSR